MELDKDAQAECEVTQRNVHTVAALEEEMKQDRSWGERFVDGVANLVGNPYFFGLHALGIGGWVLLNSGTWLGMEPFDPYPWEKLRTVLSLEAILIACTVLMIQGRMKQQNARQSHLQLQIAMLAEAEATRTLRLLRALCQERGLPEANDPELATLIRETEHGKLMDEVEDKLVAN